MRLDSSSLPILTSLETGQKMDGLENATTPFVIRRLDDIKTFIRSGLLTWYKLDSNRLGQIPFTRRAAPRWPIQNIFLQFLIWLWNFSLVTIKTTFLQIQRLTDCSPGRGCNFNELQFAESETNRKMAISIYWSKQKISDQSNSLKLD